MARLWVMMLLAFDVVFVTLSLWTFEAADDRIVMADNHAQSRRSASRRSPGSSS